MERINPEAKRQLSKINKLTLKIEQTARETSMDGYTENSFGSFDRVDLTSQLLKLFETLVSNFPEVDYFRYLHAGALARANRTAQAVAMYSSLREAGGHYAKHAVLMLVSSFLQLGDRKAAEETLEEHNNRLELEGYPQLKRTLDDFKHPSTHN